jgi:hypothetical protein
MARCAVGFALRRKPCAGATGRGLFGFWSHEPRSELIAGGRHLLVDGRSPAAEPFFAATCAHTMGLASLVILTSS